MSTTLFSLSRLFSSERTRGSARPILLVFAVSAFLLAIPSLASVEAIATTYQGFGATTPGGSGGTVVHVTNLNNSGPGSFRDAVSQGNRYIVFDVGGEIVLDCKKYIYVAGAFITIDGFTAPPPGITLRGCGLSIRGDKGGHNVIVRGIKVRNAVNDGIQLRAGAYNVVIDHVSIHGSGDGNLDITKGSHDVTVSWSILAEPAGKQKNMLISRNPSRISVHHNIFVKARQRNPKVKTEAPATDTTIDMRNNLVWDWGEGSGTKIVPGPRANIVNNFYSSPNSPPEDKKKALKVKNGARVYVDGNFSADNLPTDINAVGNEKNPFPAPFVDTLDACAAARQVLARAGARPLDLVDQRYLSAISLPVCVAVVPGRLDFRRPVKGLYPRLP